MSENKMCLIQEVMDKIQESETIVKRIDYSLADAMEECNEPKKNWCFSYVSTLRALIKKKLDEATAYILEHVDEHLVKVPETKGLGASKQMQAEPIPLKDNYINVQRDDLKVGIWINHENTGYKPKPIEFEGLSMNADIPKQYADDSCVMRAVWYSYDSVSYLAETPFVVLGGVYDISIFRFPELPKSVKEWKLRSVKDVDNMLVTKPYPPPDLSEVALASIGALRMSYQVQSHVYIPSDEDLQLCWWDQASSIWTDTDISDVSIDRESKIVSFKTKKLAPMALLLPRISDYPYSYFFIRSVSDTEALIDLTGPRLSYKFRITPGCLEFINHNKIPELSHLDSVPQQPGVLLFNLSKCGVHLLPENRDCIASNIKAKDQDSEELAILDISMNIRTFAFRSTRWNKMVPPHMVCVRVRENLEYDEFFAEDEEQDWRTVSWYPNKCSFVNLKESSDELDLSIPEGHETHFLMNLVMKDNCSTEAEERMSEMKSFELSDTVKKTLRLLKILSFT